MNKPIQEINQPDYRRIFIDIIQEKCPEKISVCGKILQKQTLSGLDILKLNAIVFGRSAKK